MKSENILLHSSKVLSSSRYRNITSQWLSQNDPVYILSALYLIPSYIF